MESDGKQLVLMTGPELVGMIEEMIERKIQEHLGDGAERQTPDLDYGLAGIARTFGCSERQAQRIKESHVIDGAISQVGNIIVIDRTEALRLTKCSTQTEALQAQSRKQTIRRKQA